jgi:hypothetical protein
MGGLNTAGPLCWLLTLAAAVLGTAVVVTARAPRQARPAFAGLLDEHPSVQYAARPTTDRVAALNRALTAGTRPLTADPRTGYLRSVIDALGVPAESQVLVFSKTGVQRRHTGPRTPRALYFDSSVVVGYIPGAAVIELAAHDPQQGVVFYTLDQTPSRAPAFARRTSCLNCHVSAGTLDVPGMIARSNRVNDDGEVLPQLGQHVVNHATPLLERWGGWFVTGDYSARPYSGIAHMGNLTATLYPSGRYALSNQVFIDWLGSDARNRGYLSADSDIAALMVFDHQMHAINLLTRLNWESRVAADAEDADFSSGTLGGLVNRLADYFLFVGEVPPPSAIAPRPGFAERLLASIPRDRHGRSLGQLDLDTRLLRYPCSYMVYTDAFDGLPRPAKAAVYRRLWQVLSGRDANRKYAHLTPDDRRAILEILRDTKSDLPEGLRAAPAF